MLLGYRNHPLKQVSGLNAGQWQDAIVDQICERIFVAMGAGNVQSAFDYFDVDGDGNIEYEEFVNALKALEIGLTDEQARTCIQHRPANKKRTF